MRKNSLPIIMLLSALPLFTHPSQAADKVVPKQAITVAAKQESGKVDINTATLAELTSLKGIGDKKAQAIVDYREKQGKFTSVDQLADVNGIGPATLEANRDMIIVK
ncbi:ComEA family DNA-binding protein [Aeromonas veronii]|uniref:ComEA family DNA-binding protein n=2 Tax=Aeromonas veronii TaxID=654 RepID=UPI001A8FF835|nr:ComEA family DNA-binding protein [Aeromonas veronii]QSR48894.1 helix-hairpin-helix domain-containing protein [Aeromonas veronii]